MARQSKTGDLLGRIFDRRYRVNELIGSGGMGSVYRVTHLEMNREVALKVLEHGVADSDKQVQRFYQEARASSKLQHPNTIRVFDFGRAEDGRLYLAMEYLRGETLTELLKRVRRLDTARICRVLRQVCKSLAEAHQTGIIHRDLKPDNIFITDIFGEKDFVKVLDFGIAKSTEGEDEESLTQTGFICGTPRYLSPEQAMGKPIDARSDLYSLGVMLYEMLTGKPPFVAATPIALVMKHIHEPPPRLGQTSDPQIMWLGTLAYALMQKSAERRPDSAAVVAQAVEAIGRREDPRAYLSKSAGPTTPRRTSTLQGRPRPTSSVVPGAPVPLAEPRTMMLDSSEMSAPADDGEERTRMLTAMPDEPEGISLAEVPSVDPGDEPTRMGVAAMADPDDEPTSQRVEPGTDPDDEPTKLGVSAMVEPGEEATRMGVAAMPEPPPDPSRPQISPRASGLVRRTRRPSAASRAREARPSGARSRSSAPGGQRPPVGRPAPPREPPRPAPVRRAPPPEEEAHPMTRVMRSPLLDAEEALPIGDVGRSSRLAGYIIAAVVVIGLGVGVLLWRMLWSGEDPAAGPETAQTERAEPAADESGPDPMLEVEKPRPAAEPDEKEAEPDEKEAEPDEKAADPAEVAAVDPAPAADEDPGVTETDDDPTDGELVPAEAGPVAADSLPERAAPAAEAPSDSELAVADTVGQKKPRDPAFEFTVLLALRAQWARQPEGETLLADRRAPEPAPVAGGAAAKRPAAPKRVGPKKPRVKKPKKPRTKKTRPKKTRPKNPGFDVF